MNYLQLSQALVREAAMSGLTSLTTLSGATGQTDRVANWINQAWVDLQVMHSDWGWMRSSVLDGGGASFAPIAGQYRATLGTGAGTVGILPANFASWAIGTFRNYVTAVGVTSEILMEDIDFDAWRNGYMYGAQQTVQTRPVAIAVSPSLGLSFGPPSNGNYTITGDYFVAPTTMSADTDTPTGLPAQYHMCIVWLALWKYGYYQAATEVVDRSKREYRVLFNQLASKYLPRVGSGGALA